jgi:hypothetical protein
MFFSISKIQNEDFPNHLVKNGLHIDFDNGWTVTDNFIYKGYIDSGILKDVIDVDQLRTSTGKFCVLYFANDGTEIITGERQKFPMYIDYENNTVTNIGIAPHTTASIRINVSTITITSPPLKTFTKLNLTDEEIINEVDNILSTSICKFKTDTPLKLFLSGGVDTLLLASYLIKNDIDYELIMYEHTDMDYFLCRTRSKLKHFWAYPTLQHWRTPNVLISGANGDEMLLRNPIDAFHFFKYNGADLVSACQENNLYHSKHFLKEKHIKLYSELDNSSFSSEEELKNYILNRNAIDYQHWHLGNTLTFTPFDNLELNQLMLNLSNEQLSEQLLDAQITKLLIEKNAPELLKYLSPAKNYKNFENLSYIYDGRKKL